MTTDPAPAGAGDAAAFMAELRRLKTWSGLSYRQLERRATAAGDVLPSSTAASMLTKDTLPTAHVLAVFVRACGLDDGDRPAWETARRRIADGPRAPRTPPPRPFARPPRRRVLAALLAAAIVTGGAAIAVTGHDTVRNTETTTGAAR